MFRSGVQSFLLLVLHARQKLAFGSSIPLELISNNYTRHIRQPFEKFAEKSLRRMLMASALHENIQHMAVLIHRSPEGMFFPTNGRHHLVHMPFVATARTVTTQFIR